MKRIVSAFIALFMLFALFSVNATAEDTVNYEEDDFQTVVRAPL